MDQRLADLRHRAGNTLRHGRRIRIVVGAGQADHHFVAHHVDASTRAALRNTGGTLAVDDRLLRVRRVQLQARTEDVLRLRTDVHPTGGRHDEVNAQRQASAHHRRHRAVQAVELAAQRAPAVDDQEHVAVAVVVRALQAATTVGVHRVDAMRAEVTLAVVHDRRDLGEHTRAHLLGVARRDARHVRGACKAGERTAAEVHDVELDFLRRVGQRQGLHDRTQRRRLTRLRAADQREVTARARQVEDEGLAALLERQVDRAQGHAQGAGLTPRARHEAELRVRAQVGHEGREGIRDLQRRQPHLVRRVALALHLLHGDVHLGHVRPHLVAGQNDFLVLVDLFLLAQVLARDDGSDRERQDLDRCGRRTGRRGLGNRRERTRRRGSGHVGRAETNEAVAARLQEARTGQRGQLRSVGNTQDLARVVLREGLQSNAVRQVRLQAARLTQVHLL